MKTSAKTTTRASRRRKIRAKIRGTADRPRLAVFRSLSSIYVQIIDDQKSVTLVASSDSKLKKGTKTERAKEVGKLIAEAAKAKKIETVVFDRGGYAYHGRVKAIAEAAREAGLKF